MTSLPSRARKHSHRTTPEMMESDITWELVPQSGIDELCQGFAARPEICLMSEELSMSNPLSEVTDRDAMKSLFMDSRRV
jgi:hypothetical protein